MNRFGIVFGGLACAALFVLLGTQLPSCAMTPEQRARVTTLTSIGLALAQSQGVISSGDSILIGKTVAVITSPHSQQEKLVGLADIGLAVAVDEGKLKPGDSLLIKNAIEVVVTPSKVPEEVVPAVELMASEQAKPPSK